MKLHSRVRALLVLAWLAFGLTASLPAADQRTYSASRFQISVDGTVLTEARAWSGGDLVADLANDANGPAAMQKQHVTNFHYAPLRVVLGANSSAKLLALMNEVLTNQDALHLVKVSTLDFNNQIASSTEYANSTLTRLELGPFDGSSKDATELALTFAPETVRRTAGGGSASSPSGLKAKSALASNFAFSLDGLPTARVAKIAAFVVERKLSADAVGALREAIRSPAVLALPRLILTISAADRAAWQTWADNFLVQGHHLDADEKPGSLTQLETDLHSPVFSLQLAHVGLARFSESAEANSEAIQRFEVELYFEGATVTNAPAPTSSSGGTTSNGNANPTSTTATSSTTPAPTSGSSGSGTANDGSQPVATPANPDAPVLANPNPRSPTLVTDPLVRPRVAAIAAPALTPAATDSRLANNALSAGDPADQGVRDPRDFPRPEGLLRKRYESAAFEASSSETATYDSPAGIDDLVAKYESALKNAKWESVRKNESGSAADLSHTYTLYWSKSVRTVTLWFSQNKSGGSSLTVVVEAHRQGVLTALAAEVKGVGGTAVTKDGSPNDLGARDPADFPRISRATRKSYNAYGSSAAPMEDAAYRAKVAIAAVEAFYVNQLTEAEWDQTTRHESGDPLGGSHTITLGWSRGKRTAKISLQEIEPAITEISVSVATSS